MSASKTVSQGKAQSAAGARASDHSPLKSPVKSTEGPGESMPDVANEPADSLSFAEEMRHGLARHRGRGRRLSESLRAAEDGELTSEQFLFVMAIEAFKRANGVSFIAWSDVVEIIRVLGYRKTCKSELGLNNAEDWTEKPDAKSNVRPKGFERRLAPSPQQGEAAKPEGPQGKGKDRQAA